MKTMKKLFAIVLSMAMLVTGLYLVPADADKVQAETAAVPSTELLSVKVQTTKELTDVDGTDMYVIRFVSSIDHLEYKQVGFRVTYMDGNNEVELWNKTDTVYERIESTTDVAEYSFSPKIVDEDAEYFITAKLAVPVANADKNYTVQAFCDTKDDARIWGQKRCVAVNDASETVLNLGVEVAGNATLSTTANAYTATVTSQVNADTAAVTKNGTVEVLTSEAGYANVRITLADGTIADLASVSKVSIKSGGTEVASSTYRNYDTSYLSGTYAGKPDTSWYTLQPTGDTQYVVATNADLYGLAVVSQTDNFAGDTVHLIADIKANIGTASLENAWDGTNGTSYPWTPISTTDVKFAGIFDGNLHTIEGIYATNTENSTETNKGFVGLFASTAENSTVKEVLVKNSYFSKSGATSDVYASVGSIVGHCCGNLEKVYSDAIVKTANKVLGCGGLVGQVYSTGTVTIKECNFAGTVSTSANGNGGIIGQAKRGNIVLQNCINNGLVSTTGGFTGGIIGRSYMTKSEYGLVTEDRGAWTITLNNCLNRGTIDRTADYVGALVGQKWGGVTWNLSNVYIMNSSNAKDYGSNDINTGKSASRTSDQLTGTNAYQWLSFDFEDVWTVVENDYPIQQCFAQTVVENEFMPRMGWYNSHSNVKEYTVSTAEELYGFAYINRNSADGVFRNKTVKLGADITVNEGTVAEWKENNFAGLREWDAPGESIAFRGSFDGQGHTISGIYMTGGNAQSFFGRAYADNITLQNFNLVNMYVNSTGSWAAGVASILRGNVTNVYTDAEIVTTGGPAAGIIGHADTAATTLTNCWYAGNITTTASIAGGLVGFHGNAIQLTINNCHVSGTLTTNIGTNGSGFTNASLGAFVGRVSTDASGLTISNSLFTGTLKQGPKSNETDKDRSHIGVFIGQLNTAKCTVTVENSYYSKSAGESIGYVDAYKSVNGMEGASSSDVKKALENAYALWSTSSTVESLELDETMWKDTANGPMLIRYEAFY